MKKKISNVFSVSNLFPLRKEKRLFLQCFPQREWLSALYAPYNGHTLIFPLLLVECNGCCFYTGINIAIEMGDQELFLGFGFCLVGTHLVGLTESYVFRVTSAWTFYNGPSRAFFRVGSVLVLTTIIHQTRFPSFLAGSSALSYM